jgi:hypothetical protein
VHILVELIGVGDTARQESLGSGDKEEERDGVDLGDDVLGNAITLGVPTGRDLTGNQTIEAQSLGNPETGALPEANNELAALRDLEDLNLVTVLTSELLGGLLGGLERLKVLLDDNLVKKLLLVGVIAFEQLRLDQTNTGVVKNVLLVLGLDVLVIDGVSRLGVNPASVWLTLDGPVVVLDETHDPGHLNATLKRELAIGLHLPSGTRVTPRTDLSETSNDNDLLEVNHAFEGLVVRSNLGLPVRALGEIELDVGSRINGLLLVEDFRGSAIDDGVLNGSLLANS